ncbi:MAG: hypothetical protein J4G18_01000 [Anaerolineae bacterium]|nr:hypothetical protein [Anaerolineae bacterium]
MVITISLDTVLIVFVCFVFIVVWHSESKLRDAIHVLRMEHRGKIAELNSENRQLRYELSQLCRELKSVERRVERLDSQR